MNKQKRKRLVSQWKIMRNTLQAGSILIGLICMIVGYYTVTTSSNRGGDLAGIIISIIGFWVVADTFHFRTKGKS